MFRAPCAGTSGRGCAAEAEAADEAAEREAETAAERAAAAERGRDLFGQYTASLKVASVLFAPDVPVS